MDSDKKSQVESLLPSMLSVDIISEKNLMIHSRSHEGDPSKLQH